MTNMRIGLVCPYHMFRGGGVQECVLALHEELSRRGNYVRIITPQPRDFEGDIPESVILLGGSVNTKAFAGTAWQWSVSVDTDAIDEVFSREKFDLLHFHEPWVPVWSRQLVQRSKSANVATMHGRFMDTMTAKTLTTVITPYTKPMIKYFDAFTAVSDAAAEYFRTLSARSITMVPNGIDVKKYQRKPKGLTPDKRHQTILYIGRLEHRKGVSYLLKAYAELARENPRLRLILAGTGPDEDKLRRYVHEFGLPRVKFTGYVSEDEKIRLLHSADLFCSPAHYGESFGIVLLEAIAAGVPIVAGDNVGYQSVLEHAGAISLVNPKDTIDFSRRLQLMLNETDIRSLWQRWAKKHVKQFVYPKIVDRYEAVYKQALEHHAKRQT